MFQFILIFNRQTDVLFHYDRGPLRRAIADCRETLAEMNQQLEDRDILMQMFSPLVASYSTMQEKRNCQYRMIEFYSPLSEQTKCQTLLLHNCADCLLLALYECENSKKMNQEMLQSRLNRVIALFHHLYGPCWEHLKLIDAEKRRAHFNLLEDLLNTMWEMDLGGFQWNFEAIEGLYLNGKIRIVAVNYLNKVLKNFRKNQFELEHLILIVGSHIVALVSDETSKNSLDSKSLLFLIYLTRVITKYHHSLIPIPKSMNKPTSTREYCTPPASFSDSPLLRKKKVPQTNRSRKSAADTGSGSEDSEGVFFTPENSSDENNYVICSKEDIPSSIPDDSRSVESDSSNRSRSSGRYYPLLDPFENRHYILRVLLSTNHQHHMPYNVHFVHLSSNIVLLMIEPISRTELALVIHSYISYLQPLLLEYIHCPNPETTREFKTLVSKIQSEIFDKRQIQQSKRGNTKPTTFQIGPRTRSSFVQLETLANRWEGVKRRHTTDVSFRNSPEYTSNHHNILSNVLLHLTTLYSETFLSLNPILFATSSKFILTACDNLKRQLHDYLPFLSAKGECNISPSNYYSDFPGLVHFLCMNCYNEKLISPRIDFDFFTNRDQVEDLHRQLNWCREVYRQTGLIKLTLVTDHFRFTYVVSCESPSNNKKTNERTLSMTRPTPKMIYALVHISLVPQELANRHIQMFIQRMDPASEDSIHSLGLLT